MTRWRPLGPRDVAAAPRGGVSPALLPHPLEAAFGVVMAVWLTTVAAGLVPHAAWDARLYWSNTLPDPYRHAAYTATSAGFFYSPAVAQLLAPFTSLPEWAFVTAVLAISFACLFLLTRRWAVLLILVPPITFELGVGNIDLVLAAVAVYGLRWPGLWAIPLLTKVTPGVGIVWFAVRREWVRLATALGTTAAVVAVSYALDPGLWSRWASILLANAGTDPGIAYIAIPLAIRLPAALLLVAWGGVTDRRWTIPVASMIALPVLYWTGLSMLAGVVATEREKVLGMLHRQRTGPRHILPA